MSSACEILAQEPERFIDYILDDRKLKQRVLDKDSFVAVLTRVMDSDPSLKNIAETIKSSGESLEICGFEIFENERIQDLIAGNTKKELKKFRKRTRRDHPRWGRKRVEREAQRRLKISAGVRKNLTETKEIVEKERGTKPIFVSYKADGKTIRYRKSKPKKLTKPERDLITNYVKRGKSYKDAIKAYNKSNLGFRTNTSLKRHYYRIKERFN